MQEGTKMATAERDVRNQTLAGGEEGQAWRGFAGGRWQRSIDVDDFIGTNLAPYEGDERFLAAPTEATERLWDAVLQLMKRERDNGGVLDVDTGKVSTITSHGPGYIDRERERIVGLQTDAPLK